VSWTCAQLAARCGGELRGAGDRRLEGISTDTRTLAQGDLFVAIAGPSFDGHDFLAEAVARGAGGVLVSRNGAAHGDVPAIRVPDTIEALAQLARAERAQFTGPVVAITGSNGKTTTKELSAGILEAAGLRVRRTPGSLNNEIGLPLSILGVRPGDDALVLELGMNHPGEIDALARIASPDVGAITLVAAAHLGPVGSIDAIARAKGELFDHLRAGGCAVLNADDPRVMAQAPRFAGRHLRFGLENDAEFRAVALRTATGPHGPGSHFRLLTPHGEVDVTLAAPGRHLVLDALCAAACAVASGALPDDPREVLRSGLARFRGVAQRGVLLQGAHGGLLLDDSYNANPSSAIAAFETLRGLGGARAIAVLGDMLELGPAAAELHAEVGRRAGELGLDVLIATGELAAHAAEAARRAGVAEVHEVADAEAAGALLRDLLRAGDAVLVKGSRGMHMERALEQLRIEGPEGETA
jgi:UDP-N-acetylmuramoyl-tripeptide--D-alanyl-D-alanine ligase